MRRSPRNVRIACNHRGLTNFGGAYFFHEFVRVLQLREFLARHVPYAISQAESLVPFADHNPAPVGGDSGTLEIDLPRSVEGELKGLVLFLTHWVQASWTSLLG
jgi:hypothetical protein